MQTHSAFDVPDGMSINFEDFMGKKPVLGETASGDEYAYFGDFDRMPGSSDMRSAFHDPLISKFDEAQVHRGDFEGGVTGSLDPW